jgi:hypothetical protein
MALDFFGPNKNLIFRAHPFQCPRYDVAPLKTITYRTIKTTGTLIVKKMLILVITQIDLSLAQHERGAEDVGCIGRWK